MQNLKELGKVLLKLRNEEEVILFLQDLLSPKEIEMLSLRLEILKLLSENKKYFEIERQTGASSATISKVSETLQYGKGGFKLVTERIK